MGRKASEWVQADFEETTMQDAIAKIEELFVASTISQTISENDWQMLEALHELPLTLEASRLIKRIMHGVRRGWVSVVEQ